MLPQAIADINSQSSLREYTEHTNRMLNNLSLGDGTNKPEQNADIYHISGVTDVVAGTETIFTHKLGRIPIGYVVYNIDKTGNLYNGSTTWTSTTVSIKGSANSIAFKLFLL